MLAVLQGKGLQSKEWQVILIKIMAKDAADARLKLNMYVYRCMLTKREGGYEKKGGGYIYCKHNYRCKMEL